jgi:hypothetical protein
VIDQTWLRRYTWPINVSAHAAQFHFYVHLSTCLDRQDRNEQFVRCAHEGVGLFRYHVPNGGGKVPQILRSVVNGQKSAAATTLVEIDR